MWSGACMCARACLHWSSILTSPALFSSLLTPWVALYSTANPLSLCMLAPFHQFVTLICLHLQEAVFLSVPSQPTPVPIFDLPLLPFSQLFCPGCTPSMCTAIPTSLCSSFYTVGVSVGLSFHDCTFKQQSSWCD